MDNGLREVIPLLIHRDQTGFIPGRHITTNICKSIDVMKFCKNNKIPAVILSIDMEKCFDRIEHKAIFGTMRMFNFGELFIRSISLFYKDFMVHKN